MSRWVEQFENHPFRTTWETIVETTDKVDVDDDTIVTSVEEVARIKKVVVFLNELLAACDPELIPDSTWQNFQKQSELCLQQISNYQSNRNISHIINANSHLDNLLSYIRPYQVIAGKEAKLASASFVAYTKSINSSLSSFQEEANSILEEIVEFKRQALNNAKESETANTRIKKLEVNYFDDSDKESLHTRINNFEECLEENYEKIQSYRNELLEGDSDTHSISEEINNALILAESDSERIKGILNDVQAKISDFNSYHAIVFGSKNKEGELEGGLKDEISAREKHLDEFKNQQETKYKALNDEIENLLPGATSAGLASAYHDLKESFDNPIKIYSRLFYGSIASLMLVAFISIIQELGWLYIKFVDVSSLSSLFSNIVYKLPVIIPILWLTLFASKRRGEALRLQQEYSHKEALAKSYQNFKIQIEALNQTDSKLMEKLLNSAIDAVSKNASDTLDMKHGDKTPAHESVDGLITSMEKLKKYFS